jgi:hypothetical protein
MERCGFLHSISRSLEEKHRILQSFRPLQGPTEPGDTKSEEESTAPEVKGKGYLADERNEFGEQLRSENPARLFERVLPDQLAEKAAKLPKNEPFDLIEYVGETAKAMVSERALTHTPTEPVDLRLLRREGQSHEEIGNFSVEPSTSSSRLRCDLFRPRGRCADGFGLEKPTSCSASATAVAWSTTSAGASGEGPA